MDKTETVSDFLFISKIQGLERSYSFGGLLVEITIKNGQRKKILFLLLLYSLAVPQSALQLEELQCAGECHRPSIAVDCPELVETEITIAQGPAAFSGICSVIPAFWPISTYFLFVGPTLF